MQAGRFCYTSELTSSPGSVPESVGQAGWQGENLPSFAWLIKIQCSGVDVFS